MAIRGKKGHILNLEDRVRMATIIDCEGWISIEKIKNSRGIGLCLVIGVGNTNPILTDWLKNTFGGSVYKTVRPNHKHKDYSTWRIFGGKAAAILQECAPHMLLKPAQAELASKFQARMHGKNSHNEPCTPEYVAEMQAMKYLMGLLNRKGKPSPAETNRDNSLGVPTPGEVIVRASEETGRLTTL